MTPFPSILVPLDGSRLAARSLGCATWLAARLDARLHVLSATSRPLPAREALARLQVGEEHWPRIVLHQVPSYAEEAILDAVGGQDVRLIVMTAGGRTAEAPAGEARPTPRMLGHVTRTVIERSPVPVLLLPVHYRERLPWERVLVPVSGESEGDEALALAVRLASALDLEVHVAHVADDTTGDEALEARARYADAVHHEYPGQLEELVRRVLPRCPPEECRRIAEVALCRGDVAAELLALLERRQVSLVTVGWRGSFLRGHARVLKRLIALATPPILLVRAAAPPQPFSLKVGEALE